MLTSSGGALLALPPETVVRLVLHLWSQFHIIFLLGCLFYLRIQKLTDCENIIPILFSPPLDFSKNLHAKNLYIFLNFVKMNACNKRPSKKTFPADTMTSQRRRKNVLILASKTQIGLKWTSRRPFFRTSPRCLPEDVLVTTLKTSRRRLPVDVPKTSLKTSSRSFLVKAKDHLSTP